MSSLDSHCTRKNAYIVQLYAIFGKVGRIASEEVVLQLLNSKCKVIPVLLYKSLSVTKIISEIPAGFCYYSLSNKII